MRILHLSDVHYGVASNADPNRKIVFDCLLETLKSLRKEADPDLLCITGDLVFSGKPEEFAAFKEAFLVPVLSAVGLPTTACFFAPGNHDQDRTPLAYVQRDRFLAAKSNEEFNELVTDKIAQGILMNSFTEYTELVNELSPPHSGSPSYAASWELNIGAQRVRIVALNSAMLSGFHDGDSALGKMRVSEHQLFQGLAGIGEADILVTLMHHPMEWLQPDENSLVSNKLMTAGGLLLYGHTHRIADLRALSKQEAGRTLVCSPASACYTQKSASGEWANGFSVIDIDETLRCRVQAFSYLGSPTPGWYPNPSIGQPNGILEYALAPTSAAQHPPQGTHESSQAPASCETYVDTIRRDAALNRLSRRLEKLLEDAQAPATELIGAYEEILESAAHELPPLQDGNLRRLRGLAFLWGKAYIWRELAAADRESLGFNPDPAISYLLSGDLPSLPVQALKTSLRCCWDNLDVADPFLDFDEVAQAQRALEVLTPSFVAVLLLSFSGHMPLLGILSEIEESPWSSRFRKANYRPAGRAIVLTVSAKSRAAFVAVTLLRDTLSRVCTEFEDSLKRHNLQFPITTVQTDTDASPHGFREIGFTADVQKVTTLVMGQELYGDEAKSVFVREIVENGIDAVRARQRLDPTEFQGEVNVHFDEHAGVFTVTDNGIGMSRMEGEFYLLRVGKSIWRSRRLAENDGGGPAASIGKFGIGFVTAMYVGDTVNVETLRYDRASRPFALEIRSVGRPVYVDEMIEKKEVGTSVRIKLKEKMGQQSFQRILQRYFPFQPTGLRLANPAIAPTAKDAILGTFSKRYRKTVSISEFIGERIYEAENDQCAVLIAFPKHSFREHWKKSDSERIHNYMITNGCIFVKSGTMARPGTRSYNGAFSAFREISSGYAILLFREGAQNISAARDDLRLSEAACKATNELVMSCVRSAVADCIEKAIQHDLLQPDEWQSWTRTFSKSVLLDNGNFACLKLECWRGGRKVVMSIRDLRALTGVTVIVCNDNVSQSRAYRLLEIILPRKSTMRVRVNTGESIISEAIGSPAIVFPTEGKIYRYISEKRLIPARRSHPCTKLMPPGVEIVDGDIFAPYGENTFLVVLTKSSLPFLDHRRGERVAAVVNGSHPWTQAMENVLNSARITYQTQHLIRALIETRSGPEQNDLLTQLSQLPVELHALDTPPQLMCVFP